MPDSSSNASAIKSQVEGYASAAATAFPSTSMNGFSDVTSQIGSNPLINHYPPLAATILGTLTQPDGVPAADWQALIRQLTLELTYQQETHDFFQSFNAFITNVFVSNTSYLDSAYQLASAETTDTATAYLTGFLKDGMSGVLGMTEIPGASIVGGLLGVLIDKVQASTDIQNEMSEELVSLKGSLVDSFNASLDTIQETEASILGNWGGLQSMGQAIQAGTITWPVPDTDFRNAAILAYKISLWKVLLPVAWHIVSASDNPECSDSNDWSSYISSNPNYYVTVETNTDKSYFGCDMDYLATMRWLGRGSTWIDAKDPGDDMCTELFSTLAIPRSDIFDQVNGWSGFTQETFVVQNSGGCGGTMVMAARVETGTETQENMNQVLDQVRAFRDRLASQGGPVGAWYVDIYYAISTPIVNLYHASADFQTAIEQYDGESVLNALLAVIQGKSPSVPAGTISNAMAIVNALINIAPDYPDQSGQQISDDLSAILPYLSAYVNAVSEDDLITIISQQQLPAIVPSTVTTKSTAATS